MAANKEYSVTNLAEVTADGFTAASFPEIKDAYVRAMQQIYGYGIDISDASADGQYIMMESLILNNIYRTLESLSNNLSLTSATGKYLDILSQISGITRQGATYSKVNVNVTATQTAATPTYLFFMDSSGNTWQWINPIDYEGNPTVSFVAGKTTAITLTATGLGAITAPQGTAFKCTVNNGLTATATENAIVGQNEETDAELKVRRFRSLGQSGRTIIDALTANLLNIAGIEDAWVYANNTDEDQSMADKTKVMTHNVYVVVYPKHEITVSDETIGETIYNILTPGIQTQALSREITEPYQLITTGGSEKKIQLNITSALFSNIYWKEAGETTTPFEITLTYTSAGKDDNQFGDFTSETPQIIAIKNTILTYLNNITLGNQADPNTLMQLISAADFRTQKYGAATYTVDTISTIPKLTLNRFYYTNAKFEKISAVEKTENEDGTNGGVKITVRVAST